MHVAIIVINATLEFEFHMATCNYKRQSLKKKRNYTVAFKLQVIEGAEIEKLVENLEQLPLMCTPS